MLNYSLIKKELLIALRGSRSQLEMSHLVGFSFNQWHKWETEQKWLRWDEFIDVLDQLKIPVNEIFYKVLSITEDPRDFQVVVRNLCAGLSSDKIAEILDQDQETIKRWARSDISPSVETCLHLMQSRSNNLAEFIAQIIPIRNVPSLNLLFQAQNAHKNVEVIYPFSAAIEACLNLEAYQKLGAHSDEWVAERTLISVPLVRAVLKKLESVGTIRKRNEIYEVVDSWIQMNGLPLKEAVKVDHYWTQRALDRYAGPDQIPFTPKDRENTNLRSFRVAPVSTEAAKLIQQRLRQLSQDILAIINDDKGPKTEIKVYVSHCFDVKDIHWKVTDTLRPTSQIQQPSPSAPSLEPLARG